MANMGFMNENLITEILLRLPVKSLVKLKNVSKQWLSMVSCRRFRQAHASRHPGSKLTATGLFLSKPETLRRYYHSKFPLTYHQDTQYLSLHEVEEEEEAKFICFPDDISISSNKKKRWAIISSCNGLVLLYGDDNRSQDKYYVCNPTTKEIRSLSIPQNLIVNVSACLAFEPSESPHYKVVFLRNNKDGAGLHIVIYCSETGTCSTPLQLRNDIHMLSLIGVRAIFCNGAIHWVSSSWAKIFYFNFDRELMEEVFLPPPGFYISGTRYSGSRYFGESRGRLRLARVTDVDHDENRCSLLSGEVRVSMLNVYELKRDYSGWIHEYRVDLDTLLGTPFIISETGGFYRHNVVSILGAEKEELTVLLRVPDAIVVCHLGNMTVKKLCVLPAGDHDRINMFRGWSYFHQYIETLACLSVSHVGKKIFGCCDPGASLSSRAPNKN